MSHSESLKPEEKVAFDKMLDEFLDSLNPTNDISNGTIPPIMDEPKKSMATRVIEKIDKWSMAHPGLSLLIFFGGGSFLIYKIGQSFVAGAVFKGNLKTARYLDRIGH